MDADAVDSGRDASPGQARDGAVLNHPHHALRRLGRIVQDRARVRARDQVAGLGVSPVGVDLARQRQTEPLAGPLGLEAGHDHEDQVAVQRPDRPGHRQGEIRVRVGDVAQRPVGLHVPHRAAGILGQRQEGADLIEHDLLDIGRALAVDRAPAEAPEIEEARMRPGLDPGAGGERQGLVHDQRVAGVEPAGDVGRTGDRQHPGIVAEAVDAETLAHVAVQVDDHRGPSRAQRLRAFKGRTSCPPPPPRREPPLY